MNLSVQTFVGRHQVSREYIYNARTLRGGRGDFRHSRINIAICKQTIFVHVRARTSAWSLSWGNTKAPLTGLRRRNVDSANLRRSKVMYCNLRQFLARVHIFSSRAGGATDHATPDLVRIKDWPARVGWRTSNQGRNLSHCRQPQPASRSSRVIHY